MPGAQGNGPAAAAAETVYLPRPYRCREKGRECPCEDATGAINDYYRKQGKPAPIKNGVGPGGPYHTEQEAAVAALQFINPISVALNREFSGHIRRDPETGEYYWTVHCVGSSECVGVEPCPPRFDCPGIWHTHAAGPGGEGFSDVDLGDLSSDHNEYLATPTGTILVYPIKKGQPRGPGGIGRDRWPRLAGDGQRIAVAWEQGGSSRVRLHNGTRWGDTANLAGTDAALTFAAGGLLHAATSAGLWKLGPQGFDRLSETPYTQPALALDAGGRPHAAWHKDGKVVLDGTVVGEGERPTLTILANDLHLPPRPSAKGRMEFPLTVANRGEASSAPTRLVMRHGRKVLGQTTVPAIAAGGRQAVTFQLDGRVPAITFALEPDTPDFDPANDTLTLHLWGEQDPLLAANPVGRVASAAAPRQAPDRFPIDLLDDPNPPYLCRLLDARTGKEAARVERGKLLSPLASGRYRLALTPYSYVGQEVHFPHAIEYRAGYKLKLEVRSALRIRKPDWVGHLYLWKAIRAGKPQEVVQWQDGGHPVMLLPPGEYQVVVRPFPFSSDEPQWPTTISLKDGQQAAVTLDSGSSSSDWPWPCWQGYNGHFPERTVLGSVSTGETAAWKGLSCIRAALICSSVWGSWRPRRLLTLPS